MRRYQPSLTLMTSFAPKARQSSRTTFFTIEDLGTQAHVNDTLG